MAEFLTGEASVGRWRTGQRYCSPALYGHSEGIKIAFLRRDPASLTDPRWPG